MSFVLFQFMPMIPGLTSISAGITDNLINALIGGAMSGIGIAIIITQGGSTGGTDIIALSINKYKNISPGRIYLVCDSLIVMSILLVNDKTLADVVYGFVEIIAFSYAVDMFLTGSQQSVQTLILSEHNDEINHQDRPRHRPRRHPHDRPRHRRLRHRQEEPVAVHLHLHLHPASVPAHHTPPPGRRRGMPRDSSTSRIHSFGRSGMGRKIPLYSFYPQKYH